MELKMLLMGLVERLGEREKGGSFPPHILVTLFKLRTPGDFCEPWYIQRVSIKVHH